MTDTPDPVLPGVNAPPTVPEAAPVPADTVSVSKADLQAMIDQAVAQATVKANPDGVVPVTRSPKEEPYPDDAIALPNDSGHIFNDDDGNATRTTPDGSVYKYDGKVDLTTVGALAALFPERF